MRVCASSEVLVCTPSRSWQLPLSGRETARKNLKTTNGGSVYHDNDQDLVVDVFARVSFCD